MKLLFWLSALTVSYAYLGYAILLAVYASMRRKKLLSAPMTPAVSIIIAAHNEESRLPAKLTNLSALRYPAEQLQIIIVSDGSTDRTADILQEQGTTVTPVVLAKAMGKANALNEAVRLATGELLVFLDVRQSVDENAVTELAACFADPQVGAVSGELLLETASGAPSQDALGIYWKIEKAVRKLESATGSVVGVTGAIYAIRRELYVEIPVGTILDDVFVPMNVARLGKRVIFQPTAIARDRIFTEQGKEFSRKVRTLTGNYQLVRLAPWLLSPRNPLLFRFISHKLLRLLVPLLLIVMLLTSAMIGGAVYKTIFVLQLVFYVAAIFGMLRPSIKRFKPVAVANTFVMLNVAAALAFYNFVTRQEKVWV